MLSESARMSSAAETRFRVQAPTSTARVLTVIALDPASDSVLARLAEGSWHGARFYPASVLADQTRNLMEEMTAADMVVMVVAAGSDAHAAARIGEVCSLKRVVTTTLVVRAASATDEALSKTLAQVRPWSLMVVIAGDDDYVEGILRSFR